MYDSPTYNSERKNELSLSDCKKLINDYCRSCKKLGADPAITFSGGDPLLRKDFFLILEECKKRKINTRILGNPYLITDKIAEKLHKAGVKGYQMSLDGLEKTHDEFRRPGSFNETMRAFEILKKHNIETNCMFTLSKKNAEELIPLIHKIKDKVGMFDFARLVPSGSGAQMKNDLFEPKEYRAFLLKILEEYKALEGKTKTKFGRKDHLWKLLYTELGLFHPDTKETSVIDGCGMGIRHLSILSDGKVVICRRMPIVIGKLPKQSLYNIFLNSKELDKVREVKKFKKCAKCELLNYCRGCPAVAYAVNGSYYSSDPQCWKEV